MFVAEMDFPVAPAIAARIVDLVGRSDTGYDARRPDLGIAFAGFARDEWGWEFDPGALKSTTNSVVALTELVRAAIEPGDGVVLTSPVYAPFFSLVAEAGGAVVDVPLVERAPQAWGLDLDALAAAFRGGARVMLLCHPHNPLGHVFPRDELESLATLAAEHGVLVLSDEIHAPLTHSDATFVPYLAVSDAARETGIAVSSASKAFNLAGLACAFWIPGSAAAARRIARMPTSVEHRTGHFGVHAAIAGFSASRDWLRGVVRAIEANRRGLRALLEEQLPEVVLHEPRAGYLAWLDFRALDWGDDPAQRILERGRVALNHGPSFGPSGRGFARMNIACSPAVLDEGVRRIARVRDGAPS